MDSLLNNVRPDKTIVLYFQVHQPRRLNDFRFFDIGSGGNWFDEELDRTIIQRVAKECYLPANNLLLKLIERYPQIRITFSLSGVIMDQFQTYAPEVLHTFRALAKTGAVEFLSETYYHSLACMIPGREFEEQVLKHAEKLYEHIGVRPCAFRNTELIYNDELGARISRLGFAGVIIDGVEKIAGLTSANRVHHHPQDRQFRILARNYSLSDDIGFRFVDDGVTLTAENYLTRLATTPPFDPVVTLGLDYETFGEHRAKETGIFSFLEDVLVSMATSKDFKMATASMAMIAIRPYGPLRVPNLISWADRERDLSAWLGNDMQRDAFDSLLALEYGVKNSGDSVLLEAWQNLQTSDHFYYMSTKKGSDGAIHNYFSPYHSPYEAFINYMNVITDFSARMELLATGQRALLELQETQSPQGAIARMTMLAER